jgi:hypothetical protein
MKKQCILLTACLFAFVISFAQSKKTENQKTPFYVGILGGVGFPVGLLGSTNGTKYQDAGFANPGLSLNLNGGYHFTDAFGITASAIYSRFNIDNDAANRIFNGTSGIGNVSIDHWQYWGLMVGPMGTIKLKEDLFLDLKLMAGYASANAPTLKFQIEEIPDLSINTTDKWKDAFVFQVGTDLRFNVDKNLFIIANMDYNFMKPKWKYVLANNGSGATNFSLDQQMGVLDVSFGVGLNF